MLIDNPSCQLVLIDVQTQILAAMPDGAAVLANALRLAQAAQLLRVPVTVTEQYPEGLGRTATELAPWAAQPLQKLSFSACDEGLIELLDSLGTPKASPNARSVPKHLQKPLENSRPELVVAGLEAHICVLQTVLGLVEDFDVFVVTDACSARTERNRDAAYDRMAAEGVNLVTTEMVLFEWLRSAEHAQFKTIQAMIR